MAYQHTLSHFDSLIDTRDRVDSPVRVDPPAPLPLVQPEPLAQPSDQTGETHVSLSIKFLGWFLVAPTVVILLLNWLCIQLGW